MLVSFSESQTFLRSSCLCLAKITSSSLKPLKYLPILWFKDSCWHVSDHQHACLLPWIPERGRKIGAQIPKVLGFYRIFNCAPQGCHFPNGFSISVFTVRDLWCGQIRLIEWKSEGNHEGTQNAKKISRRSTSSPIYSFHNKIKLFIE